MEWCLCFFQDGLQTMVATWPNKDKKNWYHSKFQLILATFGLLIPKLCSDKSKNGGKWILVSHWLILSIWRIINQWETRIHFPPLSDLSEHSFGICGPNVARISWNFECVTKFLSLWGQGATALSICTYFLKIMKLFNINTIRT